MPGWAYVLESLTRGAEGYQDYLRLTLPTGRLLCVPGAAELPGSLNACLSLMATLRKLMWSDVKLVPVAQMTPLEQKQLQDEQDRMCLQQMMEMHDREDEEISSVVTSAHSLARALHDFGHGPAEQKPGGPAKNALFLKVFAGTSRAQYDSSRVIALQQQGRVAGRTAGSTSLCQVPTLIERHRVQVVIVLCLVQLAQCWLRWEERSNMARGSGKWLEGLLLLVSFLDKPELIALVTAQLARSPPLLSSTKTSNTRPRSPQEGVGAAWERYAAKRLDGRLLPGCCHLGCTNMGGAGEAALKTLLCSGCKRARYCSIGCQRAAWREGGHHIVCGKQTGVLGDAKPSDIAM